MERASLFSLADVREQRTQVRATNYARVERTRASFQALFGHSAGSVVIRVTNSAGVSSYMGELLRFDHTGVEIRQASGRTVELSTDELAEARSFTISTLPK